MSAKRSRPSSGETRPAEVACGSFSLDALDALAERVDGAFVLLVKVVPSIRPAALPDVVETPKYRRRVFLSAAAAERAARAAAARGETCRIFLAELSPLHIVRGWES